MEQLQDGELLAKANRLTEASGNGRLRRTDGTYLDISGGTDEITRTLVYDWTPPSKAELDSY